MIRKLSSINILLAIVYVLVYLKSGTFNSTSGILAIIVFNWLGLRSFELDDYAWGIWHFLTGGWTLYFVWTLMYGSVTILTASITYNFITNDTLINLILTFIFSILVMLQFLLLAYNGYKQFKSNS